MGHFNVYLAGVMDSDGSISIYKKQRQSTYRTYQYGEVAQISWKKDKGTEKLAQKIKEKYGGCVCTESHKSITGGTITVIRYSAGAKTAEKLIRDIVPYMHLKKDQALLMLEMRDLKSNDWGFHHPKPDYIWEREDEIYNLMKKQKSRGRVYAS